VTLDHVVERLRRFLDTASIASQPIADGVEKVRGEDEKTIAGSVCVLFEALEHN
jgi:hypothetical protein